MYAPVREVLTALFDVKVERLHRILAAPVREANVLERLMKGLVRELIERVEILA